MLSKDRHLQLRAKRLLIIILTILLVGGVALLIWLLWAKPALDRKHINSFEACVSAGNPVLDSYPAVCVTKDNRRFNGPGPNLKGSGSLYYEQRGEQPPWR